MKLNKKKFVMWLITACMGIGLCLPVILFAQESEIQSDPATGGMMLAMGDVDYEDRLAMLDLLSVLEEETEIATKTKMNSDYVPGMVTVLHGDQLEALGIKTVADALSLVPGVQVTRIASGEPTVKVRGFTFPFNAGNIKVMLNSIALSRESSGINSSVLLMPVSQIDRVEIIRGPGSSIYGNFAMAGVVNIITRNSGGKVYVQGGDDESLTGGGHYAYQNKEHSLNIGINASVSDNGESATVLDRNPEEQVTAGVFHVDYKDFSFKVEGVKRDAEYDKGPLPPVLGTPPSSPPAPGSPATPDTRDSRLTSKEESWAMEASQDIMLGPVDLKVFISYLSNEGELKEPDRIFGGDRLETGMEGNWEPFAGNQLLVRFSYVDSTIDDASEPGRPDDPRSQPFAISDVERENYSVSVQDQISLFDNFTLTLGLRYDNYDDVDELLTPRIAGVYQLGENHVLKAQYSEGFRAPTFWESYRTGKANEELDFEVMETTELIYIYRQPGAVGRVTLYYSEIEDGIFAERDRNFENYININSRGAEIEWDQKVTERLRVMANVSYIDTEDDRWTQGGSDDSPGVANWLANLAFFFEPLPKLMITGRWLHVGDQYSPTEDVDGYDPIDLTVSYRDLLLNGITLSGGVRNIFDDTITYTTQRPHGLSEDEFTGQTFWVQLSYDF